MNRVEYMNMLAKMLYCIDHIPEAHKQGFLDHIKVAEDMEKLRIYINCVYTGIIEESK